MTINRYWAAFLTFALALVGAIVVIPSGALDWKAAVQLALLGVTTATTVGLPLLPEGSKWRGFWKIGAAVVLAVLSALTPLIVNGVYDHVTIGLIVLSVLQVIAGQVGVTIREDAKKREDLSRLPVVKTYGLPD